MHASKPDVPWRGGSAVKAKHVELIAIVAEAGSLGAAATVLKRSQTARSKALQVAEADIVCKIFPRSPAGVVPTVEARAGWSGAG